MDNKEIYVWATFDKEDEDDGMSLFCSEPRMSEYGEWWGAPDLLNSPDIDFGLDKPVLYKLVRINE